MSSGIVRGVVAIGCRLYEIAQGRDGRPYAASGAVGGLAHVPAVVALRPRS